MTSSKNPDRLSGRTKLITAASIVAVGLASTFAIGANLGILASADESKVGTVAAAGDLIPAATQVVDVYLDEQGNPLASDPAAPAGSQRFTVDAAGTVDVSASGGTVRVDLVTPASGWTATRAVTNSDGVAVTFTNGARTLEFIAAVGPDGALAGDVTEPSTAAATPQGDDDHESDDDESEDHESEDHESEDHEYEGGDSDD